LPAGTRPSYAFSSLAGKQAIDQAKRFKDQLRSLSPKPEHASLLTVTHAEQPHMEVAAVYDAGRIRTGPAGRVLECGALEEDG
jgi:hypothetical protein